MRSVKLGWWTALLVMAGVLGTAGLLAEEKEEQEAEEDLSAELPRIPPHEPADALGTFHIHEGFRIEQAAAEPLVQDPVAMAFDERGRLYVCQMCDYSEDDTLNLGVIRLLVDQDEDGRFDESHVFADGLSWPTALTCWEGGVFVGAAPDIHYYKDTDGDGRADEHRVVFTGFGRGNVQGLFNSFLWGLDNRIHVATSSSGGAITCPERPDLPAVNVSGRNFAFDPRTLACEATSGAAQHGMSFDDSGRTFVCSNSDHIQLVMFEDRYLARNPHLPAENPRLSIAADGPQAEVFRTSPVEPWRIVRTRLRVAGAVPGPIEGGGRAAGYFTGATGVTIYRGDAFPAEYHGQAFVGDVGSNLMHRKALEPNGVELIARRADQGVEFLTSEDIWFRPCQFANAPDGTLYICDVYREVIEHPLSLPPIIKKHLDLTSGRDRGRIYRIVPEGFQQPKLPRLDEASNAQLVATLASRNGWHRDTASRLLYERQDSSAVPLLQKLVSDAASSSPAARIHALHALEGLDALTADIVLVALSDPDARVREHAIRLAEGFAEDRAIQTALVGMAGDDDVLVRYQLAFTLGEFGGPDRIAALARIARRDPADRWIRLAVLSSLAEAAGELFSQLAADTDFRRTAEGRDFLGRLTGLIAAQGRQADIGQVLGAIESLSADEKDLAFALIRALGEGLSAAGSPLRETLVAASPDQAGRLLDELLDQARQTTADEGAEAGPRVEAIRTLALGDFAAAQPLLAPLLDHRQSQELQLAALATLDRFQDPAVAEMLLEAWVSLSPRLRAVALESLFARSDRLALLLDAVEEKQVAATEIEPARVKLLQSHADPAIRERAATLFASVQLARRQDVVDAYRSVLAMEGDRERGRLAFRKVCAACHKLEGVGHEIGPNLATIQNRGAEAILLNVLDPSREVNPQYVNYVLVTDDGRSVTGMIAAETATSVTLKRAEGASDTVLRIDIDELESTRLSLMPEGVEKQIDPQTMADLIAYLSSLK